MEFRDKLRKIRKESGMSQEELAAQLNVSRQAVSKWESGQGYPETDKLLQISSMFSISLDYLLKDEGAPEGAGQGEGYYASRETVEGYLLFKRRGALWIGAAVAFMILGLICPMLMEHNRGGILFLLFVSGGVGALVARGFMPNRYRDIETQPLLFDPAFLREFEGRYHQMRKHHGMMVVTGVVLCIMSLVLGSMGAMLDHSGIGERAMAIMPVIWATAVFLFINAGSALSALDLIARNEEHVKELEREKSSGPIFGLAMPLAAMIYLVIGFVWDAWHPGWIIFPAVAILCAGISGLMGSRR